MNIELEGKLIEKFDTVQVSDKFRKREFVLDHQDGKFNELIKFQLVQDKTEMVDAFQIGDQLKVSFNIKGNKWKDNYFVNLQVWKLEKISEDTPPPPPQGDVDVDHPSFADEEDFTDDLPF